MISFATFPSVPAPVARSPMWSTNYLLFRISKIKAKEETKIWERKDHLWLEQSISVDIRYHLGEKSTAQTRQSTEWGQKKWAMFTGCSSRQQAKLMTGRPASDSGFIKWIQSDLRGLFLGLLVSLLSLSPSASLSREKPESPSYDQSRFQRPWWSFSLPSLPGTHPSMFCQFALLRSPLLSVSLIMAWF